MSNRFQGWQRWPKRPNRFQIANRPGDYAQRPPDPPKQRSVAYRAVREALQETSSVLSIAYRTGVSLRAIKDIIDRINREPMGPPKTFKSSKSSLKKGSM